MVLLSIFPGARTNIRSRSIALAEVLSAFAAVYLWERTYPGPNFHGLAGVRQIPHAITQLWWGGSYFILNVSRLSWIGGCGCILAAVRFRRVSRAALSILAGGLVLLGMLVVSAWVRENAYMSRFLASPAIVVVVIACYPLARTLASLAGSSKVYVSAMISAVCIAAATVALGFPSPARAEAALDRLTGADAPAIAALGCTLLLGNYWEVWPRVFYRDAHPTGTPLWGIAPRAQVTRDLWDGAELGTRSYCSICGDSQVEMVRKLFRMRPLKQDGQNGRICAYREDP